MAIDQGRTRPTFGISLGHLVDSLCDHTYNASYRGGGSETTGIQSLPVTIWETNDAFHAARLAPGESGSTGAETRVV